MAKRIPPLAGALALLVAFLLAALPAAAAPAGHAAATAATGSSGASTATGSSGASGATGSSGASGTTGAGGPPVAAPVGGAMRLQMLHVYGDHPFVPTGQRMSVHGTVKPFVAGQKVTLRFFRDGRVKLIKTLAIVRGRRGSGYFQLGYTSPSTGVVTVTAVHPASPQQLAMSAGARVRYIVPAASPGRSGPSVYFMQQALAALHYYVAVTGRFDDQTGRALIAYEKMTGLNPTGLASAAVFRRLSAGAGGFTVRYPRDGKHVEADLDKQVLALIEPGGHVHAIYEISSGKPSTPTVVGHFQVDLKTPGVNSKDMYDSNYFISGYAIHGYPDVPTYAASHGCLRVPNADAPGIFAWLHIGNVVDVYHEGGGGSTHVNAHAGP